jgi:prevent-host-death family protein
MSSKHVTFSKAREQLSTLIDEVRRSGRSVTITRRGQPAAVLVSCETFEEKIAQPKTKPWRLRGSAAWRGTIDVDEAIREARGSVQRSTEAR